MAKRKRARGAGLTKVSTLALADELHRRRQLLPELLRRHDAIAREIESLGGMISALGGKQRRGKGGAVLAGGSVSLGRRRPRNEMNLVESLAKLLTGRTMSVVDAAAEVQKAGYRTTSPNFRTMVNIALMNKKRFRRVSRGMYTAK